jgi:hypothetical protein
MSWTKVLDPYGAFKEDAKDEFTPEHEKQWSIELWETVEGITGSDAREKLEG